MEKYEYSTYGELTIKNASGQTISTSAIGNRHTYTGREWDEDLELYYYRARWYDPIIRRFTQKDIVHFTNRYIYVGDNPMNYIDPLGNEIAIVAQNSSSLGDIPYIGWILQPIYDLTVNANHFYLEDTTTGRRSGKNSIFNWGVGPSFQPSYGRSLEIVVPGTKGIETKILDYMDKVANKGMLIPWINDCRTVIDDTLESFEISVPPQTPGRINTINRLNNLFNSLLNDLLDILHKSNDEYKNYDDCIKKYL